MVIKEKAGITPAFFYGATGANITSLFLYATH
jgi:hypothetical protein